MTYPSEYTPAKQRDLIRNTLSCWGSQTVNRLTLMTSLSERQVRARLAEMATESDPVVHDGQNPRRYLMERQPFIEDSHTLPERSDERIAAADAAIDLKSRAMLAVKFYLAANKGQKIAYDTLYWELHPFSGDELIAATDALVAKGIIGHEESAGYDDLYWN